MAKQDRKTQIEAALRGKLNRRFDRDICGWFTRAVQDGTHNPEGLLRLTIRVIFQRFLDQQGIHTSELFNGGDAPDEHTALSAWFSGETDWSAGIDQARDVMEALNRILDRYAFTIEENSPLVEEVAIDPEALGRVFENLLAAGTRELGKTLRKQTGSFYTPREIVNYMVAEALTTHFSSALPGQLQSSPGFADRLRALLSDGGGLPDCTEAERAVLVDAVSTLTVLDPSCGSGAFLMGMLHRLAHLLSRIDPQNRRWKQKQLERLAAIQEPATQQAARSRLEAAFSAENSPDFARKLYLIENCLYGVDIQPAAVEITRLRMLLALAAARQTSFGGGRLLPAFAGHLVAADFLHPHTADSLFGLRVGFDVVISNPPYGASVDGAVKKEFSRRYGLPVPVTDTFVLFALTAFPLLKLNGINAFIVPSSWLYMPSYARFRAALLERYDLDRVVLFREPVFRAVVECCIVFSRNRRTDGQEVAFREVTFSSPSLHGVTARHAQRDLLREPVASLLPPAGAGDRALFARLAGQFAPLSAYAAVICGLTPYRAGKGVPPQTEAIVAARAFDAASPLDASYRQYIMGRDFHRYGWQMEAPRWIRYGDWLAEPRYGAPFDDVVKIVVRQTADAIIAHIDARQYLSLKNVHNIRITHPNLRAEYLLGLMNAKLLTWWYRCLIPEKDRVFAEVKVVNLKKLPICMEDTNHPRQFEIHDQIVALVQSVLAVKGENRHADTAQQEREIDQLVYELYGLTEEEIRVVEGNLK